MTDPDPHHRPRPDRPDSGDLDAGEALIEARRAIEAMIMVATDPMPEQLLAQIIELPTALVRRLCEELAESYRAERRGFQLVEIAGGWRYQSHPDCSPYVERFVLEGQSARLSTAALETLAIVAYKQPISRAQVSAIRGVNVDSVLRTLVQRGYLGEVGRDDGPGQAVLFGTTVDFLEKLGLASLDELPPLGDFVPGAHVVEALEETLRVGPPEADAQANPDAADHESNGAGVAPRASAVDSISVETGPVIDLTDPVIDLDPVTPQHVVESLTGPRTVQRDEPQPLDPRSSIEGLPVDESVIDLDGD